jgi:hypothetical protein
MGSTLRATDRAGLRAVTELLHDHWFSVSAVVVDLQQRTVRLGFGPYEQRLGALVLSRRLDAPDSMRTLTIRNVTRCALADTQRIDTYTLNRIDYDPSSGLLRVVTCEPMVFDVEAAALDVIVD